MATNAFTYNDNARREDLLGILTNLDPTETQLSSGLGTSTAKDIRHEWLIDTLGTVKTNAYIEGADASYQTLTDPARLANYCQILREAYQVTESERAVNPAAYNDRYEYEMQKALRELKNDLELALLRGSMISGTGTAARQMRGIKNSLSLVTSQSGTSLSESMFNDYLQLVWDNTNTEVSAVYGSMYIKRKISGFTSGSTKFTEVTDRRLINAVDVYEADAAKIVKIFAHRYARISGDTNHDVLGINEDMFKVAYLRKPNDVELAKTGDSKKGEIVTEVTLENRHYNAGFLGKAHL